MTDIQLLELFPTTDAYQRLWCAAQQGQPFAAIEQAASDYVFFADCNEHEIIRHAPWRTAR